MSIARALHALRASSRIIDDPVGITYFLIIRRHRSGIKQSTLLLDF